MVHRRLLAISKHRVSLRFVRCRFQRWLNVYTRPRVREHLHSLRARAPFNLLPTSILATSLLTNVFQVSMERGLDEMRFFFCARSKETWYGITILG